MEKTIPNSSIPNFEYKVVARKFVSSQGQVFIECKTKKEMNEKLFPILEKHLFFCVFDRVGDEANDKKFIARIRLGYHNEDFCEYQITQVLKRIKIGKITKSSDIEKSGYRIACWDNK